MSDSPRRSRDYSDYTPPRYRPVSVAPPKVAQAKLPDVELDNMFLDIPRKQPKKKKKKPSKKVFIRVIIILFVLLALGGGGFYWYKYLRPNHSSRSPFDFVPGPKRDLQPENDGSALNKTPAKTSTSVRLVATGDMIPHSAIMQEADKGGGKYDFTPMLQNMKQYFTKADVRFCNQATPAGGAQFGISGYPVFNASLDWPRALEDVGCNVINVGTNHTNDKGQPLVEATAASWDNRPNVLAVAGANRSVEEQNKVHYFTAKGIKFAFLTYTTYTNNKGTTAYGINMYSDALVQTQMKEARTNADFVMVSMRWGKEYSPDINAEQDKLAQQLSDLGADVVIGHGPHFMEPVKKLKGKDGRDTFVWFSLGNFLNAQLETETLIGGFATMDIDSTTKKVTKVSFMPVYMHYEWTAAQKKAEDLLSRRNFSMYPLDEAASMMAKSQIGTTVEAQQARVKALLNKYTEIPIVTGKDYLASSQL